MVNRSLQCSTVNQVLGLKVVSHHITDHINQRIKPNRNFEENIKQTVLKSTYSTTVQYIRSTLNPCGVTINCSLYLLCHAISSDNERQST